MCDAASGLAPTREPWSRRARIELGADALVLAAVHQDVHECVAHRPGRGERAGVIPVGKDAPSAAEGAIDGASDADGEAAHARRESAGVIRFGDEVNVIGLDRELDDPKARTRRGRKGALHGREDPVGAETPKRRDRA
jgi:hypothetical protein